MATSPNPPGDNPPDNPDVYVGLTEAEAEARARGRGWSTVRSLPPGTVVTLEYLAGRINFIVDEDRVQRCWLG